MKHGIQFFPNRRHLTPLRNEKGMVMAVILMLVAVLVILGTTGILTVTTDMKISANYRENARAFYDAEAGINVVLAKINEGSFDWPDSGDSQPVSVACPADFKFNGCAVSGTTTSVTVTNVDGTYCFQVTGHGDNNAVKTIEVRFKRKPVFGGFGLFADGAVDLKNSGQVYSYNSTITPNPNPTGEAKWSGSTQKGDVGSNTGISLKNKTYIDGNVRRGGYYDSDNKFHDANYTSTSASEVHGSVAKLGARVDPDPLGAVGGELATKFTTYSATNDNTLTGVSGVSGTVINASGKDVVTLVGKPGGANYYISSLTLKNSATLNVNIADGPVNIYLTGALELKNNSTINVTKTPGVPGSPLDFSIFSNSTNSVIFKHGSAFKGVVYAPYAPIEMKNSADTYGLIWGGSIDIKNSGQFYFDEALNNKFVSKKVVVVSWKDVM